jgi:glycosyltransferase involved in cell wall biosynthesis
MGSLRPVKNFKLVAAAAAQLAAAGVQFVHLGDPMGWDRRTRGVSNLHYLPFEHNPFPVITEADVFGSTSHKEAFSRASLEAMACGKPVVGPRAGGSLDLIEDGVSGRFFAADDAHDFAAKIRWYHDDRRRVGEHGEAAVKRVESNFSTSSMLEAYLRLYDELTAISQ